MRIKNLFCLICLTVLFDPWFKPKPWSPATRNSGNAPPNSSSRHRHRHTQRRDDADDQQLLRSQRPAASALSNQHRAHETGRIDRRILSLYVRPWYVEHGGSTRRTLDMIDAVYRAVERHPRDLMFATSVADIRWRNGSARLHV